MAWLPWLLVPSIVLLAAVAVRARLREGHQAGLLGAYRGAAENPWFSIDPETRAYYQERFEQIKQILGLPSSFGFLVDPDGSCPRGHAQAVSWLSIQIARQAGLSGAEIEEIRLARLLHDIGKMHVPWHVLNKPALLTPEEFEVMKSHSACGEEMLRPFGMRTVERIVRHHHERYDGKGYPDGLTEERIPVGARIVALAEAFDDMVSDQPYKSARTFEEALNEIRRCSGTQFDPKIAEAFLHSLGCWGDTRQCPTMEEGIPAHQIAG